MDGEAAGLVPEEGLDIGLECGIPTFLSLWEVHDKPPLRQQVFHRLQNIVYLSDILVSLVPFYGYTFFRFQMTL